MRKASISTFTIFLVVLAACAPPKIRGTFRPSVTTQVNIDYGIGEIRNREVGESIYQEEIKTLKKETIVKTLAAVESNLDLGHKLNIPAGTEGPLLTRSEGDLPSLCFFTSGIGQVVTLASGVGGKTMACLVDIDKDGSFDVSMFSTREKYFPLSNKVPYITQIIETEQENKPRSNVDFIYNGFANGILRFSYREFVDDYARPAFTQDLTYEADADGKAIIGFKGMRIHVLKATNQNISYIIEKEMQRHKR